MSRIPPTCICGHGAGLPGELFGCWSTHETNGLECTCHTYTPRPTATDIVLEAQRTGEPVADVLARAIN